MNRFANVFALLTSLLLISIGVAVIIAAHDIESIVITGPLFSVIGLVLCIVWFFHRRGLWAPLVALSLPAVSLAVFFLIYTRRWSPQEAQQPVTAVLLVYQVATVVVGLIGIREQLTLRIDRVRSSVQFSIKALLALTGIVAVTLGAVRMALDWGAGGSLGLAIGFTVVTPVAILLACIYPPPPTDAEPVEPLPTEPEKKPMETGKA